MTSPMSLRAFHRPCLPFNQDGSVTYTSFQRLFTKPFGIIHEMSLMRRSFVEACGREGPDDGDIQKRLAFRAVYGRDSRSPDRESCETRGARTTSRTRRGARWDRGRDSLKSKANNAGTAHNDAPMTVSLPELLDNGSDRKFRDLINSLFALFATTTSIRDGYADCLGLAGPQYMILLGIRHLERDGPVYVNTIAEHTRLSGSFITVETNKLKALGLLQKIRGASDRRTVRVSLTEQGNDLLDSIAEMRRQVNNVQFGCLSAEEFQMLVPLVRRLLESGERAKALLEFLRSQDRPATAIAGLEGLVAGAIQPQRTARRP